MASSSQIQLNSVPIGRILVNQPCTDCEDDEAVQSDTAALEDRVSLSEEAQGRVPDDESEGENATAAPAGPTDPTGERLTQEELREVERLQATDREVRAHEQAHKAAAGGHARGGPSYEYTTGPDGKRYAVAGEVQIDTSPVPGNPQATIAKAQTIRRAALAPADPSPQDRRVASQAVALETRARQELQQERTEKAEESREETSGEPQAADASGQTESTGGGQNNASDSQSPVTGEARHIAQFERRAPETGQVLNLFS